MTVELSLLDKLKARVQLARQIDSAQQLHGQACGKVGVYARPYAQLSQRKRASARLERGVARRVVRRGKGAYPRIKIFDVGSFAFLDKRT